ncbi:transglutaminase-like domain-containing protein [Candidatus Gracilibacteria bacterium]|nr:transglutaminase-like domain-containing protein [Candidatus Gracilibacteria bacterium]
MKYLVKIITTTFVLGCICVPGQVSANSDAKKNATALKEYISENYQINDQFPIYNQIRERISELITEVDSSEIRKRQLYKDLAFYHNNNIVELVTYITTREGASKRFVLWKQEAIEKILEQETIQRENFSLGSTVIFITQEGEGEGEGVDNGEIYRYSLQNPVLLTDENKDEIYKKKGFIVYQDRKGLIFTENYTRERKIPFIDILNEGSEKFLLYSDSIFSKEDYFSTYGYEEYYNISNNYGIYISDVEASGYNYSDAVFLRLQDAKNNVTFAPELVPIVQTDVFPNISQENFDFINTSVTDQLRFQNKNYSQTIKSIKQTAEEIVQGLHREQDKIKAIYDWMIQNIEYPDRYDITDPAIFSGLEAFENRSAVCEGQARLMYYMLKSIGIQKVNIIDGYVVDAPDFPQAGHAWIQIGDTFYDPSFETVYQEYYQEYKYYNIPYDVAYINRYNLRDIPEILFTRPSSSIEAEAELERRSYAMTDKYGYDTHYEVLERAHFKKRYGIEIVSKITLRDIMDFPELFEIRIGDGKVTKNTSPQQSIIEYTPFPTIDSEIDSLLEELDYDISNIGIIQIYQDNIFSEYGIIEL